MLSICDFMSPKNVSQKFCFQFLTSCSLWYPYVKKLHRVPYLAFGTNFFPKIKTAKTPTTAERQLRHAHTEIHKLQYHHIFLVLFSMLYPLFNKTKRNFNETVCERTRFAKILTTYLLFTVEGILFSERF